LFETQHHKPNRLPSQRPPNLFVSATPRVTPITMSTFRLLIVALLLLVPSASVAGPTTCLTWSQWIARGDAAEIIKCVNDAKPYTIPDGISALTNLKHL
jgi:hypothetical protein